MSKAVKSAAVAIAAIGIMLLVYAILSAEPASDTQNHMGMWDGNRTYSSTNIGLIIVASAIIAVAIAFVFLKEEYEPLPSSMAPPPPPVTPTPPVTQMLPTPADAAAALVPEPEISEEETKREEYLVLRLLTGDERVMFKAVMDAGGEALQKDLIKSTRMSNAKVSRVLDRLSEKGVITKERYGATNRIRIRLVP